MSINKLIFLINNPKFSVTPKKICTELKKTFPEKKFFVRSIKRPQIAETEQRKIYKWGHPSLNKLEQYKLFKEHNLPHPEWTTDFEVALKWIETIPIIARTKLNSFGGKGCYYISPTNDIAFGHDFVDPIKVFTKYKKKTKEFRVHVFNNEIIDIQQKCRKRGFENRDNQIRNYKNGWIYCRNNIEIPEDLKQLALDSVKALSYNQGAADIIWNEKENKCYILEVNTAPGLSNNTLEKYKQAFINYFNLTK